MTKHRFIAEITDEIIDLLGISPSSRDICVHDEGLKKHLIKRHHDDVLPHLPLLESILTTPDYVGVNPREKVESLEYIKRLDHNILVAIKLHKSGDFFYIPSMYTVSERKIGQRLYSGRLKVVDKGTGNC